MVSQTLTTYRSDGVGLTPEGPVGNQVILARHNYLEPEDGETPRAATVVLVKALNAIKYSGYLIPDHEDYVYDISEEELSEAVFSEIQVPAIDEAPDLGSGAAAAPSSREYARIAKRAIEDVCGKLLSQTDFTALSKARKTWLPGVEERILDRCDERADQAATVPMDEMLDTYDAFAGDDVFSCFHAARFGGRAPRKDVEPRLAQLMTVEGLRHLATGMSHAPRQYPVPAGIAGRTKLLLDAVGDRGVGLEPLTIADTSRYRIPKHGNGSCEGIFTQLPPGYLDNKIKAVTRRAKRATNSRRNGRDKKAM